MATKKAPAKAPVSVPIVKSAKTDQYYYDLFADLHDEIKAEMTRRQRAGERWLALRPLIDGCFRIKQSLRIFIPVEKRRGK
jgi:hypothetical protein